MKEKKITEVMNEYKPNNDIWSDDEEYMYQLKMALDSLQPADKIIFVMYCEMGSLRKVGKELGVSHTIIYKHIQKIKKEIYDYIKINFACSNNLLLNRFKRLYNFN